MEDNDLPDFDADDLLAAMAEELRKDEVAREAARHEKSAPEESQAHPGAASEEGVNEVADDGVNDPLSEIVC